MLDRSALAPIFLLFSLWVVACGDAARTVEDEADASFPDDAGELGARDAAPDARAQPADEGEPERDAEVLEDAGEPSDADESDADRDADDPALDSGELDADIDASTTDGGERDDAATRDAEIDAGPVSWPRCEGPRFATEVVATAYGPVRNSGDSYGQDQMPRVVLGPPMTKNGVTPTLNDVVTLGNGGSITLGFDARIVDGPGVDFIVFENPFSIAWAELATVSVSDDGVVWHEFPCTAPQKRNDPPSSDYGLCAGWHVVATPANDASWTPASWTNPQLAGGDAFDLADLPGDVQTVRFVRITDRVDLVRTDDVTSPASDTFDLDAVSIVHARCP